MTNKKLLTGLIGVVLFLLVIVGMLFSANSKLKNRNSNYSEVVAEKDALITHYVNKAGEEVAKRQGVETNLSILKEAYSTDIKAIKNQLGVNTKDIKGIYKAVTTTSGKGEGSVDTVTIIREGVPVKALSVSDSTKWFSIHGIAFPNKFVYNYHVRDSITLVPYKVGKNLYVKGTSANPNTHITGLQGILVSEDPGRKPWGIGPSIQIGYDTQIRITPGLSVQYSLIRF